MLDLLPELKNTFAGAVAAQTWMALGALLLLALLLGWISHRLLPRRRLTNLGSIRAYVTAYLHANPHIAPDKTLMVRQLAPGATGLPLEVYCFTDTTAWGEYEGIQADLFDHLLSILPEFGLRLFQQPTGGDLRVALAAGAD